jgi:hypothetical protein
MVRPTCYRTVQQQQQQRHCQLMLLPQHLEDLMQSMECSCITCVETSNGLERRGLRSVLRELNSLMHPWPDCQVPISTVSCAVQALQGDLLAILGGLRICAGGSQRGRGWTQPPCHTVCYNNTVLPLLNAVAVAHSGVLPPCLVGCRCTLAGGEGLLPTSVA